MIDVAMILAWAACALALVAFGFELAWAITGSGRASEIGLRIADGALASAAGATVLVVVNHVT